LEASGAEPDWWALDVASGDGHAAAVLAPHVANVFAIDKAEEKVSLARTRSQAGHLGVDYTVADATALPFSADVFDLVTCRLSAKHFGDVQAFLAGCRRLLRPHGRLVLVDNVVPGSLLHGKRARRIRQSGDYINIFESLRDPRHVRYLSLDEWRQLFYETGLRLTGQRIVSKELDFHAWTARMQVPPLNAVRLEAMLRQAPQEVAEFLQPRLCDRQLRLTLREAVLVAERH
jgi:ubiquinone/menaquinone biosynthesis C-methylase UbiE